MSNSLPATGTLSSVADQGEAKTALENQRDFVSNLMGGDAESELTISSGSITPPTRDGGGQFSVDTEADASTDDLSNIAVTNMQDGQFLLIRANNAARTIVVKDTAGGSGQIILEKNADFSLTSDDMHLLLRLRGTSWYEVFRSYGAASNITPMGYKYGFQMANNGTDADHDLDVAIGACRDALDTVDMKITTALVKQLDATWVTGTNQGMLSSTLTSPANDTWYHIFVIRVDGVDDIGADTSITAANLIADHGATHYRRIGSVLTDGSANIVAFRQLGNRFVWDLPDYQNSVTLGTTLTSHTLAVPTGLKVLADLQVYVNAASTIYTIIRDGDAPDPGAPAAGNFDQINYSQYAGSMQSYRRITNTSGQIVARQSVTSGADSSIITYGWDELE